MRGSAIRLCVVLWLFGYALVIGGAIAQGRFAGGMMIVANVPLILLGIAQAVALSLLFDHLETRSGHVKWILMAFAGLFAAMIQTAANAAPKDAIGRSRINSAALSMRSRPLSISTSACSRAPPA